VDLSPDLVAAVAAEVQAALLPYVDADWSVPARDMEWSCAETVAHIADSFFAHAARIVARPTEWFVPASVVADEPGSPRHLLQVADACAGLLAAAAAVADPATRAYHPWGASDPAGSVAMGAAEGLLHAWDVGTTLGGDWRPPDALCEPVVARLFPDAPGGVDAADALLWCTGRVALPGRPRRTEWRWYGEP
jgi:hypothetical protein